MLADVLEILHPKTRAAYQSLDAMQEAPVVKNVMCIDKHYETKQGHAHRTAPKERYF